MNSFQSLSSISKTRLKMTALFTLCAVSVGAIYYAPLLIHTAVCLLLYSTFKSSLLLAKQALSRTDLKNPVFIPNKIYRNLAMTFTLLYITAELALAHNVSGFIAIGIGFIFIAKLKELHHLELLRSTQILTYYFIQLLGGCGYLWLGYNQINMIDSLIPLYLINFGYVLPALALVIAYPPPS